MLSTGQPASPAGLTLPANLTLSLKCKSGAGHYFTLSSNTTKTKTALKRLVHKTVNSLRAVILQNDQKHIREAD